MLCHPYRRSASSRPVALPNAFATRSGSDQRKKAEPRRRQRRTFGRRVARDRRYPGRRPGAERSLSRSPTGPGRPMTLPRLIPTAIKNDRGGLSMFRAPPPANPARIPATLLRLLAQRIGSPARFTSTPRSKAAVGSRWHHHLRARRPHGLISRLALVRELRLSILGDPYVQHGRRKATNLSENFTEVFPTADSTMLSPKFSQPSRDWNAQNTSNMMDTDKPKPIML